MRNPPSMRFLAVLCFLLLSVASREGRANLLDDAQLLHRRQVLGCPGGLASQNLQLPDNLPEFLFEGLEGSGFNARTAFRRLYFKGNALWGLEVTGDEYLQHYAEIDVLKLEHLTISFDEPNAESFVRVTMLAMPKWKSLEILKRWRGWPKDWFVTLNRTLATLLRTLVDGELSNLERLILSGWGVSAENLARILNHAPNLIWLDIRGNTFGQDGVLARLAREALGKLEGLSVNQLRDEQLAALLGVVSGKLNRLYIGDISEESIAALGASPNLSGLKLLQLAGPGPRKGFRTALAFAGWEKASFLGSLETLDIWGIPFTSGSLKHFKTLPFARLRVLNMVSCNLGNQAVEELLGADYLAGLRELDLSHNGIGIPGFRALSLSTGLGLLEVLHLDGNSISKTGVAALTEARQQNLRSLRRVSLIGRHPFTLAPAAAQSVEALRATGVEVTTLE